MANPMHGGSLLRSVLRRITQPQKYLLSHACACLGEGLEFEFHAAVGYQVSIYMHEVSHELETGTAMA